MNISEFSLAAALVFTSVSPTLSQEPALCPANGAGSPLALHEEWIMEGWERREGDPAFDFVSRMGKYYDLEDSQGTYWDNFAPGDTQLFDDASIYGANWEDLQNGARSVQHGITAGNDAIVGDNVASTTLGFVGRLERLTDEVLAFDARSQLGWACVDGEWKIKHEMNYAWVVEPESIEPILGKRLTP
ncbi:MAG TPA: hypothetical protein VGN79_08200 [Devosia sp.]|jgi:hypothetical protein|nr:hypothetical protein [Devosia sp.]